MTEQWIVAKPGGPAGPFWSIVSNSGRVIAMQIPDEATARQIVYQLEEVDRLAAIGLKCATESAEYRAERDDLAAKLDAVYQELHELRIRAGLNR